MNEHQTWAIGSIRVEREAQDRKWGEQNHADEYWMTILAEEVGELAYSILHHDDAAVHLELTQVGAVAVAWMEALYRRIERRAKEQP